MKTTLIVTALMIGVLFVHADRAAESADTARGGVSAQAPETAMDPQDGMPVGDHYLVPHLPASVVDRLPAVEATGDRYLSERIALAELVVGQRILAAEDLATIYAHDLPGFADVLISDGFRQDTDGSWYYDRYASWMRFPLQPQAVIQPPEQSRAPAPSWLVMAWSRNSHPRQFLTDMALATRQHNSIGLESPSDGGSRASDEDSSLTWRKK